MFSHVWHFEPTNIFYCASFRGNLSGVGSRNLLLSLIFPASHYSAVSKKKTIKRSILYEVMTEKIACRMSPWSIISHTEIHTQRYTYAFTHLHTIQIGRHIPTWAHTYCTHANQSKTLSYMCPHRGFTSVSGNCQKGFTKGDRGHPCRVRSCSGWCVYTNEEMTWLYLVWHGQYCEQHPLTMMKIWTIHYLKPFMDWEDVCHVKCLACKR